MIKVRAKQDGTYGGYLREGPIEGVPGVTTGLEGEVFEVDDRPYPAIDPESGLPIMEQVLDKRGNPMVETVMVQAVDEKGNPVVGVDKKPLMQPINRPKLKQKTWSFFAPEWMEKVHPDTPITYEENSHPRGVHPSMKPKKTRNAGQAQTLSEIQEETAGKPAEEVTI